MDCQEAGATDQVGSILGRVAEGSDGVDDRQIPVARDSASSRDEVREEGPVMECVELLASDLTGR